MFIVGISMHERLTAPAALSLVILAGLIAAATLLRRRGWASSICIAAGLALTGAIHARLFHSHFPPDHISVFASESPRLARIELHIDDPPRIVSSDDGGLRPAMPRQVAIASVRRILLKTGWQATSGTVLLQISEPHARLRSGQLLVALGMLDRPAPAMNPGQFDWASYYRRDRILNSFSVARAANVSILDSPPPGWLTGIRQSVRHLLELGFTPERAIDHALLGALLLGDRDPQMRSVQQQFIRTGTSHHLAISGMHVAVLGGFVFLICRVARLRPRAAAIIGIGFVLLYGAITLPSAPVVRSVLLCMALATGTICRRSVDPPQLLSLCALAMLIYDPMDLFGAGFQLSFGVVLGLMLLAGRLHGLMSSWFDDPDLRVLRGFGLDRPTFLQRQGRALRSATIAAMSAGLVAWAVSAPLVAIHFDRLNPWAIPASILLAIPVFFGLIGGLLKVMLTLIFPGAAGTWAMMAAWPMQSMRGLVDGLASLPLSDLPTIAPPLWAIAGFYLLLGMPLIASATSGSSSLAFVRRLSIHRFGPISAGALIFMLPALGGFSARLADRGELRMTVLHVGAGNCAVVRTPGGSTLLFDAGSASFPDIFGRCIEPYLRINGLRRIDAIFISHPNADHLSGIEAAIESGVAKSIYTSSFFAAQSRGNPAAESLLQAMGESNCNQKILCRGDHIDFGDGTRLDVLWPGDEPRLGVNDAGLVLALRYAGRTILFTGDIQTGGIAGLLGSSPSVGAEVLIAPHHGSCESNTAEFIAAVAPRAILSSNDRTLTAKQRQFDQTVSHRPAWRTHESGAVSVTIHSDGTFAIRSFLNR